MSTTQRQKFSYFGSKIYNNNLKDEHWPTYAFLNRKEKYGWEQVKSRFASKPVEYLIVLINGQQLPTMEANINLDRLFGQPLTGIHRVLEKGFWKGKCRILCSPAYPSVASHLYQTYRDQAIILDIINPKNDWQHLADVNQQGLKNISNLILELLKLARKNRHPAPKLFIAGYSRGGIFALRLTEQLKSHVKIKALVTLDPVISEISDSDAICIGWGMKVEQRWKINWEEKLTGLHLGQDSFPILRNPGVPCYNVFQRKAFWAFNAIVEKPMGSAVKGAHCPSARKWKIQPALSRAPYNQYDLSVSRHSAIIEKYSQWVSEIALTVCPLKAK